MWFYLIVSYGLCFGFQNKVSVLHGLSKFTDALLKCTFCTGFHCGWMAWLCASAVQGQFLATGWHIAPSVLAWAFASAGFCYAVDAGVRYLESNTVQDED